MWEKLGIHPKILDSENNGKDGEILIHMRIKKTGQATHIAPLNRLPLLPSGPGGIQQELVV